MAQAMVSFRMDEGLKTKMEEICKEMGLTLTAAFTMFAAKVTQERGIPFRIRLAKPDPFYNAANLAHLDQSLKELDEGKGIEMTMDEWEAFIHEGR